MCNRNISLFLFSLVFLVLAYGLITTPPYYRPSKVLPNEDMVQVNKIPYQYFKGRVIMPDVSDLYILDNSAGRDITMLGKSLQGRAAGLHWISSEYFLNHDEDIIVGLKLSIDSMGHINNPEIVYCNIIDDEFKRSLIRHIRTYWVYPRSKKGNTEFWFPVKWLAKYER